MKDKTTTETRPAGQKPGFFARLLGRIDKAMKAKAESNAARGRCCCTQENKANKDGKCC